MELTIMSVYDSKAKVFLPPFTVVNVDVGIRVFTDAANQVDHQFCKWPADFCLYKLGTFQDENAFFEIESPPEFIGLASAFRKLEHFDIPQR